MTIRTSLFGGAALGVLFTVALVPAAQAATHHKKHHVAAPPPADSGLKSEVDALKAQVDALQARADQDAAAGQQTQAQVQQLQGQLAQADARADRAEAQVEAQIQTIPGVVDSAVAKSKPKTDALYVKGLKLTLGGFTALETVSRDHNMSSDIATNWSAIPYPDIPASHANETRFSARQSRVSLLAQGDVSPTIHLSGYGEFDFLADAQTGNSNSTNSFSPRIRNLYGAVDVDTANGGWHFLAGQNWSLLTTNTKGIMPRTEAPPPTIDAQYVPGFTFARQPQLRVAYDFNKQWWFAVSLENSQSTFASGSAFWTTPTPVSVVSSSLAGDGSGGSLFFQDTSFSLNSVPDVIGKVAFDDPMDGHNLHLEGIVLARNFMDRVNVGGTASLPGTPANHNTEGYGVGGDVVFQVIPKQLDFQFSGLFGRGIGRYETSGLPDVALGPDGNIHPIQTFALMGGITAHITPKLDFYLFGGEVHEDATFVDAAEVPGASAAAGGTVIHSGLGDPVFANNFGCLTETTTAPVNGTGFGVTAVPNCNGQTNYVDQITAGFWHKAYQGSFGRFQWGIQYSYTQRAGFASTPTGSGAVIGSQPAPHTTENVLETSFRYYPF